MSRFSLKTTARQCHGATRGQFISFAPIHCETMVEVDSRIDTMVRNVESGGDHYTANKARESIVFHVVDHARKPARHWLFRKVSDRYTRIPYAVAAKRLQTKPSALARAFASVYHANA